MKQRYITLVFVTLLGGCADVCSDTVIARSLAPQTKTEAVMFERSCGATTGFTTQIALVAHEETLAEGKVVYRADADHGSAVTGTWGGPWADMAWTGSHALHIRYATKSRIFRQKYEAANVKITYEEVDLPALK